MKSHPKKEQFFVPTLRVQVLGSSSGIPSELVSGSLETITTNEYISGRMTQQRTECSVFTFGTPQFATALMKNQGRLFTVLSNSQQVPSGSQNRDAETSIT